VDNIDIDLYRPYGLYTFSIHDQGWDITHGGGKSEEFIKNPFGYRWGGSYADITAVKGTTILRINTVDTYANGAPTYREIINATRIQAAKPNDTLWLIPKR
jgi:hypothetical protein